MSRSSSLPRSSEWSGPAPEQEFYQRYTTEEDKEHTNVHYEQPPEFFTTITGGRWNVYSCNLWDKDNATDDTAAQEAKLDMFAEMLGLKAGQRILDVGSGWGGPLTYLSKTYGVEGVGLTLSPTQKAFAEQRIAKEQANVRVIECHWRDYEDDRPFDAIFTDEVIVHFSDLQGFFAKAHSLLRPGGMFLNKELHFSSSQHTELTRGDVFLNEIYGLTGNYRMLWEELKFLDDTGFELSEVRTMARRHYQKQAERWQANMYAAKDRLQELVGAEHYRRFRIYLKLVGKLFAGHQMTIDVVLSTRL
jgi:cyclopropane-fatty-acyl-phospholipid synthase